MKEKLKILFIPIAVIIDTVSWAAVADRRISALYTVATITPILSVIAAVFAIELAKKTKVKTALLVNGVAFAVSMAIFITGTIINQALLRTFFGCTGLISAIGFVAFVAEIWKSKRPNSYKIVLRIMAALLFVLCVIVIFSAIRLGAGYVDHNSHKRFAWVLMIGITSIFGALAVCLLRSIKSIGTQNSSRRLGVAVAVILCGVLGMSSAIAAYYSPEIKVTSVYQAQIGAVALGISGKDAVCVYDCNGAKVYLVRREKSDNFRDTFEISGNGFYTRIVDGVVCKMEDKGFLHFFRVLSFTPVDP